MSKTKKILIGIAIVIVALVLAIFLFIKNLAKSGAPQYSGQIQLNGLQQPVQVSNTVKVISPQPPFTL